MIKDWMIVRPRNEATNTPGPVSTVFQSKRGRQLLFYVPFFSHTTRKLCHTSPGHPSTADEAWYWPKCVLNSARLYITPRPIFIREMWFIDCSCKCIWTL